MNLDTTQLLTVLATAAVMWAAGWVRTFLARRVKVETPDSRAIKALRRDVRAIVALQDVIMDTQVLQSRALKAVLEAQKGICNGNVDKAIALIDGAETQFEAFLRSRARPDAADEEE